MLRDWAELGKVDYKTMVSKYNDKNRWQGYVINEVTRILTNKHEVAPPLKQYVIDYVNKTLPKINLEEAVTDLPEGGFEYKIYSSRLNLFCENWEMNLSQNQLLDLLYTDYHSVYEFEEKDYKKRPSNYVLNKITDKKLLKDRILENIKEDRLAIPVLGSHFYLCRKLKMDGSKAFLYKELEQTRFSEHEKIIILDIFLSLGGEITDLLDIFKSYKKIDYWYWGLADKLLVEHADIVCSQLIKILKSRTSIDEEKITASLKLLNQGSIEGLRFFCTFIKKNKRSPYDYHFWQSLADIQFPLEESLDLLFDILIIAFSQPAMPTEISHFNRLDLPIYNFIYTIGLQSDKAYKEVVKRYEKFIGRYKYKYPSVKNIHNIISSLENQYYKNKEEKIEIQEIIKINSDLGIVG